MLCLGHKRDVSTVYASLALTPAPTHHIWHQKNWLVAVFVLTKQKSFPLTLCYPGGVEDR